jgi:cytochrome c oxidase cbb3-type subunit IV
MDINDLRSAVTVAGFVLFLALVRWVWTARRRPAFDAAAQLPFVGEAEGRSDE